MANPHALPPAARRVGRGALALLGCLLLAPAIDGAPAAPSPELHSTWPQAYSVRRDHAAGRLCLGTPYYTLEHDLHRGGALAAIRLTYGRATNLLVQPLETRVRDAAGNLYSDLAEPTARVTVQPDGLNQRVTVSSELRDAAGRKAGLRLITVYDYRWGYLKIHKELSVRRPDLRVTDVCPVALRLAPSLTAYAYRDGLTEAEGAPAFSFGSCHWGKLTTNTAPALDTPHVPRYVLLADPGVEGLEWFVASDLTQWDLQLTGKRGQGKCTIQRSTAPSGVELSVSAFQNARVALPLDGSLVFDCYLAVPLLEGHAFKPWFHNSFNRNRGDWVSADQLRAWAKAGFQTVHCHNDGDYYGDGLFWRDGSYPPYPDMEKFDAVIAASHDAGLRMATYFSNKELHPSTTQFQQYGPAWGRMNRKGALQHNAFNAKSEFGVQMCLHSGWLEGLKTNIDCVLTHHRLDGVYYDWNVALLCANPAHEHLAAGQPAAGHWDIDELLNLMEWTRRRVGPAGLVILHNTTTPMFATENFANSIVANEWGYGKWSGQGPALADLPLEWSLVGARPRGVISYGQLDAKAPLHLRRLFALEALLAGVTPWPASPETLDLFPLLQPIGDLTTCRFIDWRNQAVTVHGGRCASAIYSRPGEAWVIVGNLDDSPQKVRCVVQPDRLPYPLGAITAVTQRAARPASADLTSSDAQAWCGPGAAFTLPADGAVLFHIR